MIVVTNDYTSFDQVFLDSALFKKPLSRTAEDFILKNSVLISQTFFDEAKIYMLALNHESCQILKSNIFKITNMIKNGGCKVSSQTDSFDICQIALELSRRNKRVCVITENEEMIDRLISEGTADVYDLNRDMLLNRNIYFRSEVFIDISNRQRITDIRAGTSLSLGDNRSYTLGKSLNTFGREGKIYEIAGQPDLVAKIYKKHPSPERCAHIKKLLEIGKKMNVNWCLFPKDILYSDGQIVGFTMQKISTKMLSEDSLFTGDNDNIDSDRLSLRRSYVLNLCLTLLAQIRVLNCYGLSVPDYNDGNFSWFFENKNITMFDTDSFIHGNYFGNTTDDAAFSRRYSPKNKNQLSLMCEEGALKLMFRLISLGLHPFIAPNQPYRFTTTDSAFSFRRSYFADNVISYLDDVFTARKDPSISLAIHELCLASKEIADTNPRKNITIQKMVQDAAQSSSPYEVTYTPVKATAASATPEPIVWHNYTRSVPEPKPARRKKRAWPWVVTSLTLLLAGIAYFLISKGIIF